MRFVIVLFLIEGAPIVAVKVEFAAGMKSLYLYNYILEPTACKRLGRFTIDFLCQSC